MRRWRSLESLPIDARNQPLPLLRREGAGGRIRTGPDEVAAMQAAMTEPDPRAIPDEEFDPGAPMIVKGVGTAVAGRAAQGVLDPLRQSVDAGAHVDGFHHQPDVGRCRNHERCFRKSTSSGTLFPGNSISQPPGLRSRTTLTVSGLPTLTGTSVSDPLVAAMNSFSLSRHRWKALSPNPWFAQYSLCFNPLRHQFSTCSRQNSGPCLVAIARTFAKGANISRRHPFSTDGGVGRLLTNDRLPFSVFAANGSFHSHPTAAEGR